MSVTKKELMELANRFPERLRFSDDKIPVPDPLYFDVETYKNIEETLNKFQPMDIEVPDDLFDEFEFHRDFILFWLRSKRKFRLHISTPMMMILETSIEFLYIEICSDDKPMRHVPQLDRSDSISYKLAKMIEYILALQNISSKEINPGYINPPLLVYIFMKLVGKMNFIRKEINND